MDDVLAGQLKEMEQLVTEHPYCVPVLAAAKLLHIKPAALRASIEQGRCPFGFCWQLGDRTAYKIPTVTFCRWILKS